MAGPDGYGLSDLPRSPKKSQEQAFQDLSKSCSWKNSGAHDGFVVLVGFPVVILLFTMEL